MPNSILFIGRVQERWMVRRIGDTSHVEPLPLEPGAPAGEALFVAKALFPKSMIAVTRLDAA